MGTCSNCGQRHGRLVKGRCNTCYRFWKRTGHDRDVERVVQTNSLRLEREMAVPYYLRIRFQQVQRIARVSFGGLHPGRK